MIVSLAEQIVDTARFTAVHAGLAGEDEASLPWLVTGAVLMVQQASVLALSEAGAEIPLMPGPSELVARVGDPAYLPQPFTAPLKPEDYRAFEKVVAARNDVMHPRAHGVSPQPETLPDGLMVAVKLVRHLVLTQPVRPSMVAATEADILRAVLKQIEDSVDFWRTVICP